MQNPPGNFNRQPDQVGLGALDYFGTRGGDVDDGGGQAVDGRASFGFERLAGSSLAGSQARFVRLAGLLFSGGAQFNKAGAQLQNLTLRAIGRRVGRFGRD
jgi:hypothetical protein